jgi:hypothetical protein
MTTAAVLSVACAGGNDEPASGQTSSTTASETADTSSTSRGTTTSTTEVALEWFGTAWQTPPTLIEAGGGEPRQLRYGSFDVESFQTSGLAEFKVVVTNDTEPLRIPSTQLLPVSEFDMHRGSVGDPLLYTGEADIGLLERDDADNDLDRARSRARLLISPTGGLVFSGLSGPSQSGGLVSALALAIPPLPAEPVGVGARWAASLPQPSQDTPAEFEFRLVEDRGEEIVVEVSVTSSSRSFGRGAVEERLEEQGMGTVVIDLTTGVPSEAGYRLDGTATIINPPTLDPPSDPIGRFTRTITFEFG